MAKPTHERSVEGMVERLRRAATSCPWRAGAEAPLLDEAAGAMAELRAVQLTLLPALQQFAHDTGAIAGTDVVEWFASHSDTLRARWRVQNDLFSRLSNAEAEMKGMREALSKIAGFVRQRPGGGPGSYQRGYDIGFNNAGLVAAGIAQAALQPQEGKE